MTDLDARYFQSVITRMLRDLDEDSITGDHSPRCQGCGDHAELAPYMRTTSDGGTETLMYCAECHVVAEDEAWQ